MQKFNLTRKYFAEAIPKKISKYADTCLSPLKKLKTEMEHRDVVFVTQQSQRWTAKELDFHSDAFAYYLAEQGFTGDRILFWTDVNHSLEYLSAAVGSIKAGSTIISAEYENWEDIQKVLADSKADILVVSPYVMAEKNKTRMDKINEALPELSTSKLTINFLVQYGDLFQPKAFPDLKQIIQISHKAIPGTEKFKHCMNYANSFMTNLTLPTLKNQNVFEIYTDSGIKTVNHSECLERISEFSRHIGNEYTNIVNSAPIFYPANFTLGFLGGLAAKSYNVIPGNYNFVDILKLIDSQKSPIFIGEDSLLDVQLSKEKLGDVQSITSIVKDVIIFSNEENLKKRNFSEFLKIFSRSKLQFYDEYSFRKLD